MGMPANDGTAKVWFSVLEVNDQGEMNFKHVDSAPLGRQREGIMQYFDLIGTNAKRL